MPRQNQGSMEVQLLIGDVLKAEAEAIVVPTTATGALTSALGRRILKMGGKDIERQTMDTAPIAIGAAVVTDGGPVGDVALIHVPIALTPTDQPAIENVRRATKAALVAARVKGFNLVATAPLCAPGETTITNPELIRAMLDEFRAHKDDVPSKVLFVLPNQDLLNLADKILESLK